VIAKQPPDLSHGVAQPTVAPECPPASSDRAGTNLYDVLQPCNLLGREMQLAANTSFP